VCADVVGYCTLRAAIMEANALPTDDRIVFAATGPIVLGSTLPEVADARRAGALEIDGGGRVTLRSGSGPILAVANGGNLTLRNIRLERSWRAIYAASGSTLTIENSTLSENRGDNGGAIYSEGTLTITNSTFSGNSATYYGAGGAISSSGTLRIENSTFSGNSATYYGGAIYSSGTLQAVGVRIFDNQARRDGGGCYLGGTADIRASTLARNTSHRGGESSVWGSCGF
jgi:predicted outer membrane repeat protein